MPEIDIDTAALTAPFPPEALEQRSGGGGQTFTYIATHAVIARLNRVCNFRWDFRITRQFWQGDVLVCEGEITIPGMGTRAAVGVQKYRDNSGEDLLKGAASDCLKKCAWLFGVGLYLSGPDVEGGDAPRQRTQQRPAQPFAQGRTQGNRY